MKTKENLKKFKKFKVKDLNIKWSEDLYQLIDGMSSLPKKIVDAFNTYDYNRVMTLSGEFIEIDRITTTLNDINDESDKIKYRSELIKIAKLNDVL